MKTSKHVTALNRLDACSTAVEYAAQFPTLQKAWDACERGDWMLWLIGKQVTSAPWSEDRKPLLACALDCAETIKHLWNDKTRAQVAVLRKWITGEVTTDRAQEARRQLYAAAAYAADAAYAAYAAAYAAAAAAYAAYAAAAAADAAYAAADAYAAAAAAYAADAAADAADAADAAADAADAAADAAAARKKNRQQTADIVRAHYPKAPKL